MTNLQPSGVWQSFAKLTQIPRPSGKKKEISEFLIAYGKSLGLETLTDAIGNVLIRKPASPGYENHPGVILQGHMDMVPQKNSDKVFDFEKDPIEAYVEDNKEWVTANGTTLGADNGIGVATAMAILADKSVVHPPLEAFFTVDEETGMYGAFALEGGWLQGKTLLNLDSETEGELYTGCAGGVDTTATFRYLPVPTEEGDIAFRIRLSGCKGGHSGCDIHLQRANANKLLFRFLKEAVANYEARLAKVEGGSLRNAIPREAEAIITVPEEAYDDIMNLVDDFESLFVCEYEGVEDAISLKAEPVDCPKVEMPEDVQDFLIHAITVCPHGVYRMMTEMPDIVETSNNLAMVKIYRGEFFVKCLMRSSVDSAKMALASRMKSVFELAGVRVRFTGGYSGWAPNASSEILATMKKVYKKMFGAEPKVMAIHAGLECGILAGAYPHWDMVSMGPTLLSPHSPDERAYIPSVQKVWDFLQEVLVNIPAK